MAITVEGTGGNVLENPSVGFSVPWPAGHAVGDVLIFALTVQSDRGMNPGGFGVALQNFDVILLDQADGQNAARVDIGIAYAVATSSAELDIVIPPSGANTTTTSYITALLRGVDTLALSSAKNNGTGSPVTVSSGAATSGNTLAYFIGGSFDNPDYTLSNETATSATGLALVVGRHTNDGTGSSSNWFHATSTGGVSDFSADSATGDRYDAAVIEMTPSAGGGGGPAAQTVTGAHITSATQMFAGAVTAGAVALSGAFIPSETVAYPGTITTDALVIQGAFIPGGETMHPASVQAGPVELSGAQIPSTTQMHPASVEAGAVALTGAFIPSSEATHAGSVEAGAVELTGAHIASETTLYPATISTDADGLLLPSIPSAAQMHPASVAAGPVTLSGPFIASGETLYPGTVVEGAIPAQGITGAHIPSNTALTPGSVTVGPVALTGAHIASTAQLFAGAVEVGVIPAQAIAGAFIASTSQTYPGAVILGEAPEIIVPPYAITFAEPLGDPVSFAPAIGSAISYALPNREGGMPVQSERIKDPNDILPYALDLSACIDDGETIASYTLPDVKNVVVDNHVRAGNVINMVVSGGSTGGTGLGRGFITVRAVTNVKTFDSTLEITIKER